MSRPPEESSEIEPPMTRALPPTEAEGALGPIDADPNPTLSGKTRRLPGVPETDRDLLPWTDAQLAPHDADAITHRGRVGRIATGQTIYSKYRVLRRLGGGAMGDVWLVRHLVLKSQHALKVIVPNIATNAVALMRFQREFEVMASLRHEHAVSIYDARIDDEGGYIDMEYVEGPTLHDVFSAARSRPERDPSAPLMPLGWVDRVLDQLCDVLQVAHDKGIIHRDLKPSNLMLLGDRMPGKEYLKVLDFGIAKIRDDPENAANRAAVDGELKTHGFIGTPSYGSPEQAINSEDIDGRSDLYSVGVLLFEAIVGRLPFRGNQWQVMHKHATESPPTFAEANPALRPMPEVERALLRVLAKRREDRPQTARALFEEFHAAILADSPTEVAGRSSLASSNPLPPAPKPRTSGPSPSAIVTAVVRPKTGLRWSLVAAIMGLMVAVGIAIVESEAPPSPAGPAVAGGPTAPTNSPTLKVDRPEDYLPDGFKPVKGFENGTPWPAKIVREDGLVTFDRIADGIYLPEGYRAEDPKDLAEDGWPRAIIREEQESYEREIANPNSIVIGSLERVRYLRIVGGIGWTMGAWDSEVGDVKRDDIPSHLVELSGFYIGETEVTYGQFAAADSGDDDDRWRRAYRELSMNEDKPSAQNHPVVWITHKQARRYAQRRSGRLITEAQWEFAARSRGQKRRYVWGNAPPSQNVANVDTQSTQLTAPVKSYPKDKTDDGAYDLGGNVKEWTRDEWGPYRRLEGTEVDPCRSDLDPKTVDFVVRGASFRSLPDECHVTFRDRRPGEESSADLGFRIVIECPDARKPRR